MKVGRRWIDDAYVAKPSSVPDIVYHYTDSAGLIGMLQNHTIWATDYKFLNDKSEVGYTWSLMHRIIESRIGSVESSDLAKLYRKILDSEKSNPNLFIFSLSQEKDDLSQWRGYARDGQGFTIGFCGTTINESAGPDRSYSFPQVEYDTNRQENALSKSLKAFEDELLASIGRGEGGDDAYAQVVSFFNWALENRAAINKHKSFSSEKEWRIVAFVRPENAETTIEIRTSGMRLVRYVELEPRFPGTKLLPIKSIGIGPGFTGAEQFDAVSTLCSKAGYKVEIYNADTPYRRIKP